ncbi:hypothetical protein Fmac_018391 [Flemingia macrophylla]|uniref:Uncharacterized protein n=1 Tax=Flemingia macrophylla TaxID=520843 RepID=A0ABD1M4U5_9FABA
MKTNQIIQIYDLCFYLKFDKAMLLTFKSICPLTFTFKRQYLYCSQLIVIMLILTIIIMNTLITISFGSFTHCFVWELEDFGLSYLCLNIAYVYSYTEPRSIIKKITFLFNH